MNKNRAENLTMNRKFFNWCKHADGKSDSSRKKIAYDIQPFTDFMGTKSYKMITSELIMEFKEELKESGISIAAYCSKLRSTRKELGYLMSQPGYKSKITPALIKYMSPTDEEIRMAQIRDDRNIMPLESVIALLESIPNDTPIGMRDRAIISLLITTGIRHKALITMPFGYIHLEKGFIYQDPRAGVKTKFRKKIKAAICNLDDRFTQSLKDWDNYLRANCFGSKDPYISRARRSYDPLSKCFAKSTEVEPKFWKSHRSLSTVLRERCEQAGLPYFPPHNFRHLLIKIAKDIELSSRESKCFSQSIGHENESMTWSYGKFSDDEVIAAVSKIDFQKKAASKRVTEEDINEFEEYSKWKKMRNMAKKLKLEDENE